MEGTTTKTKRQKAHTLLEVLIATLIFSLITYLASLAFDQSLKHYGKLLSRGINFWEETKLFYLKKTLSSAYDYYVFDSRKNIWCPFFIGKPDTMAFVTASPLMSDHLALSILTKEITSDGKEKLVYYELPIYTQTLEDIEKILSSGEFKAKSLFVTLFEEVSALSFGYFGYNNLRKRDLWTTYYDSCENRIFPKSARISYKRGDDLEIIYAIINTQTTWKAYYNERYGSM